MLTHPTLAWGTAAGDEALCAAVAGPLEVMGKKTFYLGDVGAGAKMKLVANMIMGSMLTSLGEGMALAEKVGGAGGDGSAYRLDLWSVVLHHVRKWQLPVMCSAPKPRRKKALNQAKGEKEGGEERP